jgi:hypothetical protein
VCLGLRKCAQVSIGGLGKIGDAIMNLRQDIFQTAAPIQEKLWKEDLKLSGDPGGLGSINGAALRLVV